jgi:hypothetical protein
MSRGGVEITDVKKQDQIGVILDLAVLQSIKKVCYK